MITHSPRQVLKYCCVLMSVIGFAMATGCGNRMKADVCPDFATKLSPVSKLGITGAGTSAAIPAFQAAGYQVIDLGTESDPIGRAAAKQIPFVASVDPVGTDGAWWDGFFDFAMRVTDTGDNRIVWSATAEYGQGGMFINQTKSTDEATRAMVADFAKHFPPHPRPTNTATEPGTATSNASGPLQPVTASKKESASPPIPSSIPPK